MSIVVFWLEDGQARFTDFLDGELKSALSDVQMLRDRGATHVTISSDLAGIVGKPGVDSVEDGKTPDGIAYDWNKADRRSRR